MTRTDHLLSVDWDSFMVNPSESHHKGNADLYDWGHREAPFFATTIWDHRAASFIAHGVALPTTTGDERTFWDRFKLRKDTKLYVVDSHALAGIDRINGQAWDIWNYDTHHDCGYDSRKKAMDPNGAFDCGNWLAIAHARYAWHVHQRYPAWRDDALIRDVVPKWLDAKVDDGTPPPVIFDRVLVCRSSAWMPPWLDEQFLTFVNRSGLRPIRPRNLPDLTNPMQPRPFDVERVTEMANQFSDARRALNESRDLITNVPEIVSESAVIEP